MARREAPTVRQVWRGVALATIAHAMHGEMLMNDPSMWWSGRTYTYETTGYSRGAIVFVEDRVVGLVYAGRSPRNPYRFADTEERSYEHLRRLPSELRDIAEAEALPQMRQVVTEGVWVPGVTAAFWSEGPYLRAAEPWSQVREHGAHIFDDYLLEPREAVDHWSSNLSYLDTEDEAAARKEALRAVWERWLANEGSVIEMLPSERMTMTAQTDLALAWARRDLIFDQGRRAAAVMRRISSRVCKVVRMCGCDAPAPGECGEGAG